MSTIVQIDAWDSVAEAAVTLRAGSHDEVEVCHAEGNVWWPALAKLPTLRYDFFDGAFGGGITAPSASITLRTEPWVGFATYRFAGARFRLYHRADDGTWPLRFDGRVTSEPKSGDGAADIEFAVDDGWLDTPLLALYAGTTGVEGEAGLKSQPKPLALGAPRYIPGKLIDPINNVFQLSSYGSIQGVEEALERLARLGDAVGDHATYTALITADIPNGGWATCLTLGLVRLGAPPAGQISFLVQGDKAGAGGWVRKPGALIRRLAEIAGAGERIDTAALAALDEARPYNLSLYLDQQTTCRQLIQSIAASVNAVAGVSWLGKLFVLPVTIGAPSLTLAADGSALPPVRSSATVEIAAPFAKLGITAARTWSVHALADVAFTAPLIERGPYDPAEQYREGHIVSLPDGSRWLFTGTTPASGELPAVGSAYWSLLQSSGGTIDPDVLTPSLKVVLIARVDALEARYLDLQNTYLAINSAAPGGSLPVDDPRTALVATATAKRSDLYGFLGTIPPDNDSWSDTEVLSAVDHEALNDALAAFEQAIAAFDTGLKLGAPTGTYVGGIPVEQLVDVVDFVIAQQKTDAELVSNNSLSPAEKAAIYDMVHFLYGGLLNPLIGLGQKLNINGEPAQDAFEALEAFLLALPNWSSTTLTTPVDGAAYLTVRNAFFAARDALDAEIKRVQGGMQATDPIYAVSGGALLAGNKIKGQGVWYSLDGYSGGAHLKMLALAGDVAWGLVEDPQADGPEDIAWGYSFIGGALTSIKNGTALVVEDTGVVPPIQGQINYFDAGSSDEPAQVTFQAPGGGATAPQTAVAGKTYYAKAFLLGPTSEMQFQFFVGERAAPYSSIPGFKPPSDATNGAMINPTPLVGSPDTVTEIDPPVGAPTSKKALRFGVDANSIVYLNGRIEHNTLPGTPFLLLTAWAKSTSAFAGQLSVEVTFRKADGSDAGSPAQFFIVDDPDTTISFKSTVAVPEYAATYQALVRGAITAGSVDFAAAKIEGAQSAVIDPSQVQQPTASTDNLFPNGDLKAPAPSGTYPAGFKSYLSRPTQNPAVSVATLNTDMRWQQFPNGGPNPGQLPFGLSTTAIAVGTPDRTFVLLPALRSNGADTYTLILWGARGKPDTGFPFDPVAPSARMVWTSEQMPQGKSFVSRQPVVDAETFYSGNTTTNSEEMDFIPIPGENAAGVYRYTYRPPANKWFSVELENPSIAKLYLYRGTPASLAELDAPAAAAVQIVQESVFVTLGNLPPGFSVNDRNLLPSGNPDITLQELTLPNGVDITPGFREFAGRINGGALVIPQTPPTPAWWTGPVFVTGNYEGINDTLSFALYPQRIGVTSTDVYSAKFAVEPGQTYGIRLVVKNTARPTTSVAVNLKLAPTTVTDKFIHPGNLSSEVVLRAAANITSVVLNGPGGQDDTPQWTTLLYSWTAPADLTERWASLNLHLGADQPQSGYTGDVIFLIDAMEVLVRADALLLVNGPRQAGADVTADNVPKVEPIGTAITSTVYKPAGGSYPNRYSIGPTLLYPKRYKGQSDIRRDSTWYLYWLNGSPTTATSINDNPEDGARGTITVSEMIGFISYLGIASEYEGDVQRELATLRRTTDPSSLPFISNYHYHVDTFKSPGNSTDYVPISAEMRLNNDQQTNNTVVSVRVSLPAIESGYVPNPVTVDVKLQSSPRTGNSWSDILTLTTVTGATATSFAYQTTSGERRAQAAYLQGSVLEGFSNINSTNKYRLVARVSDGGTALDVPIGFIMVSAGIAGGIQ